MIQLSTVPLLPAIPGARPAGSQLATTSDFALAIAELTAAIVPPAIANNDTTSPRPLPTLQYPAATGSDLPVTLVPAAPAVISVPPPPVNEQPILEAAAPFVIVTFADPLPEELPPVPSPPVQIQPSPTPEVRVANEGRANRQRASQEPQLPEVPVPLPASPFQPMVTPALLVAVSPVSDSARPPSQPPAIAEATVATPPVQPEAAPQSRIEVRARAGAADRSYPSVTMSADADLESPSDDSTGEDTMAPVDQTAPVALTSSVATPIADTFLPTAPVPALRFSASEAIASNPVAVVDTPRDESVRWTTRHPYERVTAPATQPTAREPAENAMPQHSAAEQSVPELPTLELATPKPAEPEPSSPTTPSHASPAPQTPAAAKPVTSPIPVVPPAVVVATARPSTMAKTTESRPTHVVDPAMSATPATPLLRVLHQPPATTIVSPDKPTTSPIVPPMPAYMPPAATTDTRVSITSPIVAPMPVAAAAPPSSVPAQAVATEPGTAQPPPVRTAPSETIATPLRHEPARITLVIAAHTPPPVVAPAPAQPQPAAQVFAAAMFAFAGERPAEPHADDPADLVASLPTPPTTPSTTVAPTPTDIRAPAIDTTRADWMERMIDRIETIRDTGGGSETRIRLSPDALGRVDVAVTRDANGALQVRMVADTPQAQQLLTEAAPRLAEMAEARGLKLGGSGVDAGSGGSSQRQPDAPTPARQIRPASTRADADTSTDTRLA